MRGSLHGPVKNYVCRSWYKCDVENAQLLHTHIFCYPTHRTTPTSGRRPSGAFKTTAAEEIGAVATSRHQSASEET